MSVRSGVLRAAAGMSAVALGAGLAVAGAGVSSAASVGSGVADVKSNNLSPRDFTVERTVSGDAVSADGEVTQGSTVTITNELVQASGGVVSNFILLDRHPACLTPVPGTSSVTKDGSPVSWDVYMPGEKLSWQTIASAHTLTDGEVAIRKEGGEANAKNPLVWSQDYTVDCGEGGLHTGGLLFSNDRTYAMADGAENIGPSVIVVKADDGGGDNGNGNGSSGNGDGGDNGNGSSGNGDGGDNGNGGNGNGDNGTSTGSGFLSSVDIFGSLFK